MKLLGMLLLLGSSVAQGVPVTENLTRDSGPLRLVWEEVELSSKPGDYGDYYYCKARAKLEGFTQKQEAERIVEFYDAVGISDKAQHREACREWAVTKMEGWEAVVARLGVLRVQTKKVVNQQEERPQYSFLKICYREALQVVYRPQSTDPWFMERISIVKQTVPCPK